jgi:hypothetical protein
MDSWSQGSFALPPFDQGGPPLGYAGAMLQVETAAQHSWKAASDTQPVSKK